MTTEEFLKRAKELRAAAEHARHTFLKFLCDCEADRGIWEGSGLAYPTFLNSHHLTTAAVYDQFKLTYSTLGEEAIAGVGAEAVIAAGKFTKAEQQREVLDECRKFEEVNGTTISEQSAKQVVHDLKSREAGIKGRHRGYAALVDENERLRFENKRLKDKIVALEAELKTLRPKAAAKPTASKAKKAS